MKQQALNPYLPDYEYVPDGEPHVFGDRVYIYGSHDRFNGKLFCMNDYVCWSAPIDDLSDWRYEGVIYQKKQEPMNKYGFLHLYAPDVAKGSDGRYYLYYSFAFSGVIAVAVCDTPAGKYEFYGYIGRDRSKRLDADKNSPFLFDPGIFVDDDGKVYLYSGFAPKKDLPSIVTNFTKHTYFGGYVIPLQDDMITLKEEPKLLLPGERNAKDTEFEGHAFFEASSMRKYKDTYYYIYSSSNGHELCYAYSRSPMGEFHYGGTIISNGDLFLNGHKDPKDAVNYTGNNHGSIEKIGDDWYVFYHRHTNRHHFSRQGMAEKIHFSKDGAVQQVEMTSCGLNPTDLIGNGKYKASIACHLTGKDGAGWYGEYFGNIKYKKHPYLTQSSRDKDQIETQYVENIRDGACIGFKYFNLQDLKKISVLVNGNAKGIIQIKDSLDGEILGEIHIHATKKKKWFTTKELNFENGRSAIYFQYFGTGKFAFYAFDLQK